MKMYKMNTDFWKLEKKMFVDRFLKSKNNLLVLQLVIRSTINASMSSGVDKIVFWWGGLHVLFHF